MLYQHQTLNNWYLFRFMVVFALASLSGCVATVDCQSLSHHLKQHDPNTCVVTGRLVQQEELYAIEVDNSENDLLILSDIYWVENEFWEAKLEQKITVYAHFELYNGIVFGNRVCKVSYQGNESNSGRC